MPGFIYHPHIAPWTPLPATLLDISARIQKKLPGALKASNIASALDTASMLSPSLASILPQSKDDLPAFTSSLANLLSIPPIHVDTIAQAICRILESESRSEGPVVGVSDMRRIAGFDADPQTQTQTEYNAGTAPP
jgi:hypothetical protein